MQVVNSGAPLGGACLASGVEKNSIEINLQVLAKEFAGIIKFVIYHEFRAVSIHNVNKSRFLGSNKVYLHNLCTFPRLAPAGATAGNRMNY